MIFFGGKKEDGFEEDISDKKFRDLKPENRKRRKEPVKPWGKKERLIVFIVLAVTVIASAGLAFFGIGNKSLSFPKVSLPSFTFLNGETTVIEKK